MSLATHVSSGTRASVRRRSGFVQVGLWGGILAVMAREEWVAVRGGERNFHRPSDDGWLGRTLFSRFMGAGWENQGAREQGSKGPRHRGSRGGSVSGLFVDRWLEHHGIIVRLKGQMIGKVGGSFWGVFSMGWGAQSRAAHYGMGFSTGMSSGKRSAKPVKFL